MAKWYWACAVPFILYGLRWVDPPPSPYNPLTDGTTWCAVIGGILAGVGLREYVREHWEG